MLSTVFTFCVMMQNGTPPGLPVARRGRWLCRGAGAADFAALLCAASALLCFSDQRLALYAARFRLLFFVSRASHCSCFFVFSGCTKTRSLSSLHGVPNVPTGGSGVSKHFRISFFRTTLPLVSVKVWGCFFRNQVRDVYKIARTCFCLCAFLHEDALVWRLFHSTVRSGNFTLHFHYTR